MALLGDRAWWLPAWLDRLLPRLSLEGEDLVLRGAAARSGVSGRPAG